MAGPEDMPLRTTLPTLRVSADLREMVERAANGMARSRSDVMRIALQDWFRTGRAGAKYGRKGKK